MEESKLKDLVEICIYKNDIVYFNSWHRVRHDGRKIKYKRKTKKISKNMYARRLRNKI